MLPIKRLTKVTNDPIIHCAGVVNVVGVGGNEDRWNRVTRLDEVQCPPSTDFVEKLRKMSVAGNVGFAGEEQFVPIFGRLAGLLKIRRIRLPRAEPAAFSSA
jgi:hypothetical protein